MRSSFLLFFIFISSLPYAIAGREMPGRLATVRFERLAIEQGLSQNNVTDIAQDALGFLWIATLDGLNRYDGYTFRTWTSDTGLPGNVISALVADRDNHLWIGTMTHGLAQMDLRSNVIRTFSHVPDDSLTLPSNRIRVLALDSRDRIWIGTRGGGLAVHDPQSGLTHRIALQGSRPGTRALHIRSLFIDAQTIWVGTEKQGFFIIKDMGTDETGRPALRIQHRAPGSTRPQHARVESIARDQQGRIWIGRYGGGIDVFSYDPAGKLKKLAHFSHDPGDPTSLSNDKIEAVFKDHAGVIWVGTAGGGVCRYDSTTGSFLRYRNEPGQPQSLSFDNVDVFFEDRSHNLWIGTWGGGLNKLDRKPKKFLHIEQGSGGRQGLSHNYIRALAESGSGDIWVGSSGGGLDRIDMRKGEISRIPLAQGKGRSSEAGNEDVRSILFDRDGNLWVGTYGSGLYLATHQALRRLEQDGVPVTFRHFRHQPGNAKSPGNDFIWSLLQSRSGHIWIGTSKGVSIFDPNTGTFQTYSHSPDDPLSLSSNIVRCLYEDAQGTIWLGTYSGLNRYLPQQDSFRRYKHDPAGSNSLSHNSVTAIIETGEGTFWLGTMGGGLNFFDPQQDTFRQYTLAHGLPNMFIHGLLFDSHGQLWISSNKGLTVFDTSGTGRVLRSYDVSDGLQSNEFNAGAALKTREGMLLFGGVSGVTAFFPETMRDNTFIPPVVLTDFKVFNKSRPFERALSEVSSISLDHSDNFFAFEFAALDFTAPEKNRYAYKMEGFDNEWIDAGFRRYAGYTNLSPGQYTFRVRASNNDGVWNRDGVSVGILIVPPFWQAWWFHAIAVLLAGGVIFTLISLRMRRLRQEKEAQEAFTRQLVEAQEQERRRLAGELHDSLGQELIIINNMVQRSMLASKDIPGQAETFAALSQEIVQTLNGVRKLSSELHPHLLERFGLVKAIEAMAKKIAARTGLRVILNITALDMVQNSKAQLDLYRIVQEVLNNVVKHAQASEVQMQAHHDGRQLVLRIADKGVGFDTDQQRESGGFGLTSIRQRVKSLHGSLRLTSTPGHGTTVELSLPLSRLKGSSSHRVD